MKTSAKEKTALITGASRGLGLALARGLAARGWNLIITARDEDRLRSVRDELATRTHVAAIAGDVAEPAHRKALAVLARGHAGLDAVVNNAIVLGPKFACQLSSPYSKAIFRADATSPLSSVPRRWKQHDCGRNSIRLQGW